MTEPPRPPGDPGPGGSAQDPTAPLPPVGATPPAGGPDAPPSAAPHYDDTPPPPPPYVPPAGYDTPSTPPPSSGAGGYPPPSSGAGGYPPPGPGYPPGPTGYPGGPGTGGGADDRMWMMIAHFGGAAGAFLGGGLLGWIAPLVAKLAQGDKSPVVREHANAALNFQAVWTIVAVVGYITMCIGIGFVVVPAAVLIGTIFGIIAGVKASNGEPYKYPMSVNMIK